MKAYILAGGEGARLSPDKGFLTVGGTTLVERVCAAVRPLVDETVMVGDPRRLTSPGLRLVTESVVGLGPLAAVCRALEDAHPDDALILPWDAPFVTTGVLRYLHRAKGEADAAVPRRAGLVEPLFAVYGPRCWEAARAALDAGKRRVVSFYDDVNVRWVTENELAAHGDWDRLFLNVNTPADLEHALAIARGLEEVAE